MTVTWPLCGDCTLTCFLGQCLWSAWWHSVVSQSPHQDTPQLIPGEIGLTQVPSLKIENPRSPISDGASDNNGWMYFQSPARCSQCWLTKLGESYPSHLSSARCSVSWTRGYGFIPTRDNNYSSAQLFITNLLLYLNISASRGQPYKLPFWH